MMAAMSTTHAVALISIASLLFGIIVLGMYFKDRADKRGRGND